MEIEYTIKIKDEQNPPIFKKELGKGVLSKIIVEFDGINEENINEPSIIRSLYEYADELKKQWFDVEFKIIK